eukprot:7088901-Pyramimonas_sp.AAC.1
MTKSVCVCVCSDLAGAVPAGAGAVPAGAGAVPAGAGAQPADDGWADGVPRARGLLVEDPRGAGGAGAVRGAEALRARHHPGGGHRVRLL